MRDAGRRSQEAGSPVDGRGRRTAGDPPSSRREGSTVSSRTNDGDRGLALRAAKGDVESFRRLVRDHEGFVRRTALRMLGEDDAQDASQEVWIRVWQNMKNFRGDSSFGTWLHRITVNTCLSVRDKKSRREEREHGDEAAHLPELSGDAGPEEATLDAERREELKAALRHVRTEHRNALVLRHMEGLSYSEIAAALDVPDGTAKGWVSRGRSAMLVVLAKEKDDRRLAGKAIG